MMPPASADGDLSPSPPRRVAVAGNPNCGKTTLFNALTGLRQKVANYPGVTVERREAAMAGGSGTVLVDLPGTYSLSARSPDEEVARDFLLGRTPGLAQPDAVLVVVDASNLERNLYLTTQLLELGLPLVVACNMMDVARDRGVAVDCEALSQALSVPVVPTIASRREGVDDVRRVLATRLAAPARRPEWSATAIVEGGVRRIAAEFAACGVAGRPHAPGAALLWLTDYVGGDGHARGAAGRLLAGLPASSAEAVRAAGDAVAREEPDASASVVQARYQWIGDIVAGVVRRPAERADAAGRRAMSATDRLDRVLTHRVWGMLVFAVVMFVLFMSIFAWAEPLMTALGDAQAGLAGLVAGWMSPGPLRSLLTDGVINGVGSVVAFFPQICILFICLGILEDSGYMARAAFLMDRLMSAVGLHGKSFIPLLSSYACAIPGILATRTIEDRRDRFATILVAPLMSCSARLPVYAIVIAAVFGERTWTKAGVLFGLYALGTATALGMALLFKKTLFAGPRSTFIMELPPYHLPRPWPILRATWDRSKLFLTRAGTTIFAICLLIWALSYFPRTGPADWSPEARARLGALADGTARDAGETSSMAAIEAADAASDRENIEASERLRHSCLGRLGRAIEPAIAPLGMDWQLGVGVLSSFLAREVFVGTMGITYAVGEADETSEALRERMAAATWPDGQRVLTPLAGVSLLVFYVLACQCVSTLAVTRRETGSWRWPAFMFGYMTVLAYAASLLVYQGGRLVGLGA